MHFLILDDHEESADVLARLLEKVGHTSVACYSVAEARALCKRLAFDMLLCDVHLPRENGLEMLDIAAECNTPIIAVSASGLEEVDDKIARGYDAYVEKPFTFDALLKAIAKVSRREPTPQSHIDATPHQHPIA